MPLVVGVGFVLVCANVVTLPLFELRRGSRLGSQALSAQQIVQGFLLTPIGAPLVLLGDVTGLCAQSVRPAFPFFIWTAILQLVTIPTVPMAITGQWKNRRAA